MKPEIASKKKGAEIQSASGAKEKKIVRISQSQVPAFSIEKAMRVPKAIAEEYAGKGATPFQVAKALELPPSGRQFEGLCGAALAYGLTTAGPNAPVIELSELGKRATRPLKEDDDLAAKREAFLLPKIIGEFFTRYDSSPLPRGDIALNVLADMGVAQERTKSVYELIVEGATALGFIEDIKGKKYVNLAGVNTSTERQAVVLLEQPPNEELDTDSGSVVGTPEAPIFTLPSQGSPNKRVYITHGKNKTFIEPIKQLLSFGELEPLVSVEKQSVSLPVPDKVMEDMRLCGAAIIHVDIEERLMDAEAKEHAVLNPNVLIEIGAAMALFGRRFILLVKDGIQLPSNLSGLYEVRYVGESLDGDATIRLLKAINAMKGQPFLDRYVTKA